MVQFKTCTYNKSNPVQHGPLGHPTFNLLIQIFKFPQQPQQKFKLSVLSQKWYPTIQLLIFIQIVKPQSMALTPIYFIITTTVPDDCYKIAIGIYEK